MRRHCIQLSLVLIVASTSAVLPAHSAAADASDEFVRQIAELIANPDPEFRAAALDKVRTSAQGAAHTRTFAAQLPKLDPGAQAALLAALADRGDAAARPAVVEVLAASKNEGVRAAALAALGEIGAAEDLPALVNALSAPSAGEQQAARTALRRMRGEFVAKTLAADSQTADLATRAALIELLAARRAASEMPALLAASIDDDARIRSAGMNALGQLAGPEQLAAMIPAVLKAQKGPERDAAERSVAAVCARIENEDARAKSLIAAIDGVDVSRRNELLSLAG
ncbi:MAG TPA: HEAT repeat domain-containing protein, partial [Pirellulales bacterium]|nr:HEAT repeat domain-containing protein [Pirellulales bacterium]